MKALFTIAAAVICLGTVVSAQTPAPNTVPVTVENFSRAESDLYFSRIMKDGGFGKFNHTREPAPLDNQTIIRLNRDTLYSAAVFDLDAGPVTITLPDSEGRFMSMQVIDEDQYTHRVAYDPGEHVLKRDEIGTRYVLVGIRTLADPNDEADMQKARAAQDGVKSGQPSGPGKFEIPAWDHESQAKVRNLLIGLADTLPDKNRMFGAKSEIDPVRFLLGAASAWGGTPEKDATYLNFVPSQNDGKTSFAVTVPADVPVNAFWSVTVYDAAVFFEPNARNAYSFNNITAEKSVDGSVTIQFGDCEDDTPNCLPISPGWNYLVRLYRPGPEILDESWKFPEPVKRTAQ